MAGFLYYIPGVERFTPDLPHTHNLAYALEAGKVGHTQLIRGPDAGRGLLVADTRSRAVESIRYHPAEQTWRPIPGGTAWAGYTTAEPPGPEDLRRGKMLDGYWCELADGRRWIAPVAREPSDSDGPIAWRQALPRVLDLDAEGNFCAGDVLPQYADLSAIAERFLARFEAASAEQGTDQPVVEFEDADAAVKALAHNYRLSRIEAVMLGLFTTGGGEAGQVLFYLVDFPRWLVLKKKQGSTTPDGSAGPVASTATTGPPSPT